MEALFSKKTCFLALILLFAGVAVYSFYPEYGDSYSEKQRKLYNTCLKYKVAEREEISSKEYSVSMQKKIWQEMRDLSSESNLEWESDLETDISSLPLAALSLEEQIKLANQENVEACYKVAGHGIPVISEDRLIYAYLELAGILGDERAPSILHWCEKYYEQDKGVMPSWTTFDLEKSFFDGMEKGDNIFYQAYRNRIGNVNWDNRFFSLMPEIDGPFDRLKAKWKEKAEQGDVEAMRELGKLVLGNLGLMGRRIIAERSRENFLTKIGGYLPKKIPWWRHSSSPTEKEFILGMQFIAKAGEAGDMEAKFIWITEVANKQDFFNRKEWEHLLTWSNELMSAGYVPMCERLLFANPERNDMSGVLQTVFKGRKELEDRVRKYLFARGSYAVMAGAVAECKWKKEESDYNRSLIKRAVDLNLMNISPEAMGRTYPQMDDESRNFFFELMEKKFHEGRLLYGYCLADEYEKGVYLPRDIGKAQALLSEAYDGVCKKKYIDWRVIVQKSENSYAMFNDLQDALIVKMSDLCLKYKDYPGRNAVLVAELLGKRIEDNESSGEISRDRPLREASWWMGRMYEEGVGVPVDKKKADFYFKKAGGK